MLCSCEGRLKLRPDEIAAYIGKEIIWPDSLIPSIGKFEIGLESYIGQLYYRIISDRHYSNDNYAGEVIKIQTGSRCEQAPSYDCICNAAMAWGDCGN